MGATTAPFAVATPAAIRNILFATDFSPCSEAALPFAIALAKQCGANLLLTHILSPEPRYELPLEAERDELNAAKQQATQCLDSLLQRRELADVVHVAILRTGEFWEAMENVIADREIDFIVTGTHGREGLRKVFLGSRAELIFRNARCPVLTVGPHARPQLPQDKMGGVLMATDFSQASLNALPHAIAMAQRQGMRLTLLHAVAPPVAAIETVVLPVMTSELAKEARTRLCELAVRYPEMAADVQVISRPAVDAIIGAAEERHYALIVLGVRHHGPMATHAPWSIADAIVGGAPCPVLTIRGN
jgi:nucleotide-binding universal stress UspA family protein